MPSIRKKFVVGNWKMHTTAAEAAHLAGALAEELGVEDRVSVAICPPFPYLGLVGAMLKGSCITLGAQNMYPNNYGAFTGEVSPTMLLDLGCKYVLIGHSERRHVLGESDAFINEKVLAALDAGLDIFFRLGETLDQRNAGQTEAVLDRQLSLGLANLPRNTLARVSIGYEPVWAIGTTGHHSTPQQAQDAHTKIRYRFSQLFGMEPASKLCIQHGGSVKPTNAAALFMQPGVDGALIGADSLNTPSGVRRSPLPSGGSLRDLQVRSPFTKSMRKVLAARITWRESRRMRRPSSTQYSPPQIPLMRPCNCRRQSE